MLLFSCAKITVTQGENDDQSNGRAEDFHIRRQIERAIEKSLREGTPSDRQAVLTGIGWIGANANFEEEICRAGYLDVALGVIDSAGHTQAMNQYLAKHNLQRDAQGASSFLTGTRKGKNLKVPVARAVADAVKTVGRVPDCYAGAIRQAVALANPNADVEGMS